MNIYQLIVSILLIIINLINVNTVNSEKFELNSIFPVLEAARELKDNGFYNKNNEDLLKSRKLYNYLLLNANEFKETPYYNIILYEYALLLEQIADESENDMDLYDLSFELLTKAAENGNSLAQHELAAAYNTGIYAGLVPVDTSR